MILAAYRESWKIAKENKSSHEPHIRMYKVMEHHPLIGRIFHKSIKLHTYEGTISDNTVHATASCYRKKPTHVV